MKLKKYLLLVLGLLFLSPLWSGEKFTSKKQLKKHVANMVNDFCSYMQKNNFKLETKPAIEIRTTEELISLKNNNKIVLPIWKELTREQKEIFNRWLGEEDEEIFTTLFNWFFIPHEMGHYIINLNSNKRLTPYQNEKIANMFAIDFLLNQQQQTEKINSLEKKLEVILKKLPPIDLKGFNIEDYFNQYYQESIYPDVYAFFQFTMILDILDNPELCNLKQISKLISK